jgi:hypothetical protein
LVCNVHIRGKGRTVWGEDAEFGPFPEERSITCVPEEPHQDRHILFPQEYTETVPFSTPIWTAGQPIIDQCQIDSVASQLRQFFLGQAQAPAPDASGSGGAEPLGLATVLATVFSYQGRLNDGGVPANGVYDLEFTLYDAATDGTLIGMESKNDVPVDNGLFHVTLDFGSGAFNGEARWLEISVRLGSETGPFTTLTPRQTLLPTPYALALPGLWTEPNATSPNLIGGFHANSVTEDVVGATISGGGEAGLPDITPDRPNQVTDNFGTIGGGTGNLKTRQLQVPQTCCS